MGNANTVFSAPKAAALSDPTATTAFKRSDDATKAALIYIPGSSRLDGKRFRISAVGKATGGTTTNLTIKIQFGTSATAASNTDLATSGAIAINSASGNFQLVAECVWDATSQKIAGICYGHVNATAVAQVINAGIITSANLANEGNGLVATALFSATHASNTVSLQEFSLEVL